MIRSLTAALLPAVVAAILPGPAFALLIDDGGTTVIDSTINDFIEVDDSPGGQPTTVRFEPGANVTASDSLGDSVFVFGDSSVIINGGQFFENVTALEDALLMINGGVVGNDALGFDGASLEVTGGVIDDDLELFGSATLDFSGGSIDDNLTAQDGSSVVMTGGDVGNDLEAIGGASVTVLGGTIGSDIEAVGVATIDLFGGVLGAVGAFDNGIASGGLSVITLYGPRFQINGAPAAFGSILPIAGQLSGTLSDGNTFDMPFARVTDGPFFPFRGEIVLVQQAVPEPTAALSALIGVGVLASQRRRG